MTLVDARVLLYGIAGAEIGVVDNENLFSIFFFFFLLFVDGVLGAFFVADVNLPNNGSSDGSLSINSSNSCSSFVLSFLRDIFAFELDLYSV